MEKQNGTKRIKRLSARSAKRQFHPLVVFLEDILIRVDTVDIYMAVLWNRRVENEIDS